MRKQLLTYLSIAMLSTGLMAQDLPYMDGTINYLKKGDYHLEKGAYVKALKAYAKGAQKNPKDSLQYFSKLAYVTKELQQYEASETYYAKATTEESSQEDILNYAEVLAANEKYDEASEWMSKYKGDSKLSSERMEGFDNVRNYYGDSLAYLVREVDFNSSESDFAPAYFNDGLLFVSGRGTKKGLFRALDLREETSFLDLYQKNDNGVEAFDNVNDILHQGPVTYSNKLGQLLVTSNHRESSKNKNRGKDTNLRILFFEQSEGEWTEKGKFPYNNQDYSVAHPTYDEDSEVLYFASNMPGGQGGVDIYSSRYEEGSWLEPVNLGPEVNTSGDEMFPFVDGRQKVLYFSSNGYGGIGGLDVYRVSLNGEKRITNLGYPVNSPKDDFGLIVNAAGDAGYLSSNREGGVGKDDIYSFLVQRIVVRSKLIDLNTKQPIIGDLRVINTNTGKEVPYRVEDGEVVFDGIQGEDYKIVGEKDGYESNEVNITAPSDSREFEVEVPIEPEEEEVEGIVVANLSKTSYYTIEGDGLKPSDAAPENLKVVYEIENIFFALNESKPNETSAKIDKLVQLMNAYPNVNVEVKGYADSRGAASYNKALAKRRAAQIAQLLGEKGISQSRVEITGVGELEIINKCTEGVECTEEEHGQNRRVEFVLK